MTFGVAVVAGDDVTAGGNTSWRRIGGRHIAGRNHLIKAKPKQL